MATSLDGRALAEKMLAALAPRVAALPRPAQLAVVMVGDNPASAVYVRQKKIAAEKVGLISREVLLPAAATQADVLAEIEKLNADPAVAGLIVQLPLPPAIDPQAVIAAIDPAKDADGFHPVNHGRVVLDLPEATPAATPGGVLRLLDEYAIPLPGAEVVIVGRSNIVGKPLANLLINRGATVTVTTSRTRDLAAHTSRADVLIVAIGQPQFITGEMVRPGAAVVDVGINRLPDGRLVGDVDFASVAKVAGYLSPVPGGVGPLTVAMLIENTVRLAELQMTK